MPWHALKYAVEHLVDKQTDNCRSRCTVTEKRRASGMRFLAENGIVSSGYAMPRVQGRCIPVLTVIVIEKADTGETSEE